MLAHLLAPLVVAVGDVCDGASGLVGMPGSLPLNPPLGLATSWSQGHAAKPLHDCKAHGWLQHAA